MKRPLIALILATAAPSASAELSLQDHVLQKGIYAKTDCKPDARDPAYDACRCEADIHYPELGGLGDRRAQDALNARFRLAAEKAQCQGEAVSAGKADKQAASSSLTYQVTFQSETILGLKINTRSWSGGAHGDGTIEGVIIDVDTGKTLGPSILFEPKHLQAVNDLIYQNLSARPEGEVFRDQVELRKGAFILDGQCQGCTLLLTPKGLSVVFQTYEVASFAEGNIEAPVPDNLMDYKPVAEALAAQREGKE